MPWTVAPEAKGKNPGVLKRAAASVSSPSQENIGGMIIYVTNGTSKEEVSRVSFIRRPGICKNPNRSYEEQLILEMNKARATCNTLNGVLPGASETPA